MHFKKKDFGNIAFVWFVDPCLVTKLKNPHPFHDVWPQQIHIYSKVEHQLLQIVICSD